MSGYNQEVRDLVIVLITTNHSEHLKTVVLGTNLQYMNLLGLILAIVMVYFCGLDIVSLW